MKNALKDYVYELAKSVCQSDFDTLNKIAELILETKKTHAHIYTAGNGGSAATASHVTNDLIKGCRVGDNTGFAASSLNDSVPVITCLANDFSYEDVFSIQLETNARKGDLLLVFSGSGNSPNIINAVKAAKKIGMTVIGFSGRDGGQLNGICDVLIIAPTDSMEQIEDMHLIYEHALVSVLHQTLSEGAK